MSFLEIENARFYNSQDPGGRAFGIEALVSYYMDVVPEAGDKAEAVVSYFLEDVSRREAEIDAGSAERFGKDKPDFVRTYCEDFVGFAKSRGIRRLEGSDVEGSDQENETVQRETAENVGELTYGNAFLEAEVGMFLDSGYAGENPDRGEVRNKLRSLDSVFEEGEIPNLNILRKLLRGEGVDKELIRRFFFFLSSRNYNSWRFGLRKEVLDELR